jgi:hypothetical protein
MRAKYGKPLRAFIKDNATITSLIDLGEDDIFDDATTYTNIISFRKQKPPDDNRFIMSEAPFGDELMLLDQSRLDESAYQLEPPIFYEIKAKIETIGTPLGQWEIDINYGIKTGLNEAFVIDGNTRDQLIAADPASSKLIKPYLRGRDIGRWQAHHADLWLIFVPWHFPLHNDDSIKGVSTRAENLFREQFPAIYSHLLSHRSKLEKRNKAEVGVRHEWYALQRWAANYHDQFEKEKLIYPDISNTMEFSIDSGSYHGNTAYHIVGNHLQYLQAILNSQLMHWYLESIGTSVRGGYLRFFDIYIRQLPIPKIDTNKKTPFINMSNTLRDLTEERRAFATRMTDLLQQEHGLSKLSNKLRDWPAYDGRAENFFHSGGC